MTKKIAFIGAGSTIFMKNIIGDALHYAALSDAHIALMDIDQTRLDESALVANKMISSLGVSATVTTHTNQREALMDADFVVVAFQIGGYDPCTITDFEIPKKHGLRQTIADTLGIGGIMRGLRTVPHLWAICEDMRIVCPDALMLNYVNPMAINMWAIAAKYPDIKHVGLCHSVQGTAKELATDLGIDPESLRYRCAGINHMAYFLNFEQRQPNGTYEDLYPALRKGYANGSLKPKTNPDQPRCPNLVRYEMLNRVGYFVTESSEHFAEYTPYFIKNGRDDLIERFGIPLDEYPKRCVEQVEGWKAQAEAFKNADKIEVCKSHEYAATIMNAIATGEPAVIYGNVANDGFIPQLPDGCAVEVPCLVDANGIQPTVVTDIPPQLIALMRTNINVQELTVAALINQDIDHIYHAAMLDPHTAAELDLDTIWAMTSELLEAHANWLPTWIAEQFKKKDSA
ncbi:alpha-glucosidase/alpha-galactosidase [Maritalea porphyrae]|uniref:alpha-glucosidase/alpha-galactosidase n=1 Tax=Maritalea porphyrae TaxID=880732 RepID=UPI0022AEC4AC|nr:alpha-glucosidase/alpha-galactosidase [Maritalea porphyrae]MCZ4271203.1 alpha-glucosidase/alpha-galactosidase [Maritalea porphyrae]